MDARLEPVVREADENRETFAAFSRSLSPAQLQAVVPGSAWRAVDYLSHLASIDIWVGEWFAHLADERPWRPAGEDGGPFDIDVWNDARIDERRDAGVEALLTEAAEHRQRLWAAVDRFTPAVLDRTFSFRGREITYLRYLQLWVAHDPAHAADMLRALPELAGDEPLRRWLGRYSLNPHPPDVHA